MFRNQIDRMLSACFAKLSARLLRAQAAERANARELQKGQASVMVAIMMVTFILFFAFVVNTGMLVNAKINLQNAADLAAYAGAATQARQLNEISFLNYEMRRQYKKFLFRYYVLGNMAQSTFPTSGALVNGQLWAPDSRQPGRSYTVPQVCIIFDRTNNFCQLLATKALVFPPQNLLDQITQTLRAQYERIEQIRQANCLSIGATNVQILMLWLYNTDPDLRQFQANLDPNNARDRKTVDIIRGLASGLGLIPHEVLLRSRINTLAKYLNQSARADLTRETITSLQGSPDPSGSERSINAYLSAYNTLGNHTYSNTGEIKMTEFLSAGTDGANVIALKDIKASFDTFATTFALTPGGDPNAPTLAKDCSAILRPITVRQIPMGVYKDPSVMTYYAVRLKARARVLFSLFGDLDLKAYAAAQPFGSKLGPVLTDQDLLRPGTPAIGAPGAFSGALGMVPNLPLTSNDNTNAGQGWDNAKALGAYYIRLRTPGAVADAAVLGPQDLERAYHAAMAPNPWEELRYNIMNDLPSPPPGVPDNRTTQYFDSNSQAVLWAPVIRPGSGDTSELKNNLDELFSTGAGTGGLGAVTGPNEIPREAQTALLAGLTKYLDDLKNDGGEQGEGINIIRLNDPFQSRPEGAAPTQTLTDPTFITTRAKARNSWSPKIDNGRTGYSVKFISFSTLTDSSKKALTNGTAAWSNAPAWDGEAEADVPAIKH